MMTVLKKTRRPAFLQVAQIIFIYLLQIFSNISDKRRYACPFALADEDCFCRRGRFCKREFFCRGCGFSSSQRSHAAFSKFRDTKRFPSVFYKYCAKKGEKAYKSAPTTQEAPATMNLQTDSAPKAQRMIQKGNCKADRDRIFPP